MRKIQVSNNQSILDLALQSYGTTAPMVALLLANGISLTDDLAIGSTIAIPESALTRPTLVNFYTTRKIKPATNRTLFVSLTTGVGQSQIEGVTNPFTVQ